MKPIFKRLTVLALVLTLVAAVLPAANVAKAVDLSQPCSLSFSTNMEEYGDIAEANLVMDLYRIATAEFDGADAFHFVPLAPYAGLDLNGEHFAELDEDLDEEGKRVKNPWEDIAQAAARIAVADQTPVRSGIPINETAQDLASGMYLVLVYGADLTDHITDITDSDGNLKFVTAGQSSSNIYYFSPVLVSLPTKEADDDGMINTANPSDWIYAVQATLKPERTPRFGGLEIVKNLTGYVEGSPATFVFQIEATRNGKPVFSDVAAITFTQAGQKSVVIAAVPVGAEVTVTEIYSGACYRLVSDAVQTNVISAEDIVSVSFTNEPTDSRIRGGAIVNQFEYGADGWSWTPIDQN